MGVSRVFGLRAASSVVLGGERKLRDAQRGGVIVFVTESLPRSGLARRVTADAARAARASIAAAGRAYFLNCAKMGVGEGRGGQRAVLPQRDGQSEKPSNRRDVLRGDRPVVLSRARVTIRRFRRRGEGKPSARRTRPVKVPITAP